MVLLVGDPQSARAADGNGIFVPGNNAVVQGTIAIQGVAQHASFRKWQLDLLINGDEKQANFIAVGEKMQAMPALFTNLDTTRFPDGNHKLRLRVVYSGLNYDEYFVPITINNTDATPVEVPQLAPEVTPVPTPTPITEPLGQGVPDGRHWVEVDISDQTLTAWQGDTPVLKTQVSTGKPGHETVIGTFYVRNKLRYEHMVGPDYDTPDVPWTMYFYAGYAIHGAYWHNNFGRPVSHGCVNMRVNEAEALFQWASVGLEVVVHD
ncbi:MAG: L,D-transpeptidase [Chloroflexi bacterium]|nr:L,D-transpeptidase [Chloroflexota bacterium]